MVFASTSAKWALIGVSTSVLLSACTTTVRIQAVDAISGKPVAGTVVSVVSGQTDILWGSYSRHTQAGLTNANGFIEVESLSLNDFNNIYLINPHYYRACVAMLRGRSDKVIVFTQSISPDAAMGKRLFEENPGSTVVIPMFSRSLPELRSPSFMPQIKHWNDLPEY